MKKFSLSLTIGLLLLFSLLFSPFVFSIDYSLDVEEQDEFIWRVDTFKEEIYNTYFSEEAEFIQGVQEKKSITKIEETSEYWKVSYNYWNYTLNTDKLTEKADSEENYRIYKDPAVQANKTLVLDDILNMWLIPTPFPNYLSEYRNNFNVSYIALTTIDDGLRAKYSISRVEFEIQIQYSINGIAKGIKYVETDGNVFVEISLYREVIRAYFMISFLTPPLMAILYIFFYRKKVLIRQE